MENEKVTIVSHISGYIHTLYSEATIDRDAYNNFSCKLKEFLATDLSSLIFINFLRFKSKYKTLFQYKCDCSGKQRYISLEKMFEYEHISKYKVSSETRCSLIKEIEGDEFHLSPIQGKIMLNDVEEILNSDKKKNLEEIEDEVISLSEEIPVEIVHEMFREIKEFIFTDPKLPHGNKSFSGNENLKITNENTREEIIDIITKESENSELSLLSLYVFRQMDEIDWFPFIKAAIERNPVCFSDLRNKSTSDVYEILESMTNLSVYDAKRLALPDEVWNFKRGDGIEKALLLAGFIMKKKKRTTVNIEIGDEKVFLKTGDEQFQFSSNKNFTKSITLSDTDYKIT
jgi:hypothetical protein